MAVIGKLSSDGAPSPPDPRWGASGGGAARGGGRVYFPGLDGLRAVAIALVYCFHDQELDLLENLAVWAEVPLALAVDPILRAVGLPEVSFRVRGIVSPLRDNGWIGVNLFFVLSGYLITTLLLRERERFGRVDLRSFWVRRILRIWPLYYLALLLGFLLTPMARAAVGMGAGPWQEVAAEHMPAFLAFLGNWSLASGGVVTSDAISVLWSVCVEEQFYLIVPLLVAWTGGRWRVVLVAVLMAAAVATRYRLADAGITGAALRYNTLASLDTLLAGVMLALLTRPGSGGSGTLARWAARAAVLAGAAAIYSIRIGYEGPPWRKAADDVLVWAWAVALVAWAASDRDRTSAWLRRPALVWLGRISYGLYVYHEIALGLVSWAGRALPVVPDRGLMAALLGPATTIGLASASYYGFERPFLRLKRRWTRVPSRPVDGREASGPTFETTAGDGTMGPPDSPTTPPTPDPT